MRIGSALRRASAVFPHRVATTFAARTRTWEEFGDRVARLGSALCGLGVEPGDRIAILAYNSDRYLEAMYAAPWIGSIIVPINTRLAAPEILHWLTDSGARTWLVGPEFIDLAETLRLELPQVRDLIALEAPMPEGWSSYEGLITGAAPIPESEGPDTAPAAIFYTGGTTGRSKGVTLSHRNLLAGALQTLAHVHWDHTANYLHAAPMFHMADGLGTYAALLAAARQTIVDRFTPAGVLDAIEHHQVTCTVVVPTMIDLLVSDPSAIGRDLSSFTSLVYGGSPMPEAVMGRALKVLPQTGLFQLYGQSEASPTLTVLGPEHHSFDGPTAGRTRSAGRATIGCEIAIAAPDDSHLPPGEVGEIIARGDNVMLGYWNQPEVTAHTLRSGWLHTGDAGYLDKDGFLFVVDRVKDMIVTGGENVYSAEVENALMANPAIAQAAVIGIPAPPWGEQVHAVVHLHADSSATAKEIIDHCRSLIAGYKCPKSVEIHPEPLPQSGAGKYLKTVLRAPYWRDAERNIN
ncbi:long-chain fatty acid--CoA ligase [Actinoallomurus acanthiterrae]